MARHARIANHIKELGGEEEHTETLVRIADRELIHLSKDVRERRCLALALAQVETGFRNVFGHDGVRNPIKSPPGGVLQVTEKRYKEYLRHRKAGEGMQGVGWLQATWFTVQDRADRLGGCWKIEPQLTVGLGDLDAMIKQYGLVDGLAAYNVGPKNRHGRTGQAYARRVLKARGEWYKVIPAPKKR